MLVLSRRVGESIILLCEGQTIEMVLGSIQYNQVRLRFLANENVKIYRKELLDRMNGNELLDRMNGNDK